MVSPVFTQLTFVKDLKCVIQWVQGWPRKESDSCPLMRNPKTEGRRQGNRVTMGLNKHDGGNSLPICYVGRKGRH